MPDLRRAISSLAASIAVAFPAIALAQVVPGDIPRTAEPSRTRPGSDLPPEARATAASSSPLVRQQVAPEAAADTVFEFRSLEIEGASAIPEATLRALWTVRQGETATVGDIFAFADAVTRLYAEHDYLLSFALVPEQRIENGAVRVEVVEGYVSAIRIVRDGVTREIRSADDAAGETLAVRTAARILESRPLKSADLERAMLLLGDLPGLSARSTISPSPDTPESSLLTIELTHRDLRADALYTNSMSGVLGRDMVGAGLTISDDRGEVRLRALASPADDYYRAFTGDGSVWLNSSGLRVDGRVSVSRSKPIGELLEAIRYRGSTLNLDLGLAIPLRRSRSANYGLTVAGHLINSSATVLDTAFTRDRLRTFSVDFDADWADTAGGINVVRADATKGIGGLGATSDTDPLRTRLDGSASFLNFSLYAQRYQPIAQLADGSLAVVARGSGQWAATDALLSAAECSYGGSGFGRSYDSGAVSADHCLMGSFELRWSRSLGSFDGSDMGIGLHGFVDGGIGRQKGSLEAGEARQRTASSAGGGVSLQFGERMAARVEAARGLTGSVGRDWRANATVSFTL